MGYGTSVNRQTVEDMQRVRAVVDTYAPEEIRQSLADDFGPTPPFPRTAPYEEYQNRVLCGLAEIVEGLATANAPKKRGRPRKELTSQDASQDRPGEEATLDND